MKEIILETGEVVLLSDVDYPFIKFSYHLHIDTHGYVQCKLKHQRMGLETGSLHRVIMQPPKKGRKIVVDHINGNKLDNRRENLRVCLHKENMRNRKKHLKYGDKPTVSEYKGVTWKKRMNVWAANISTDKHILLHLGYFDDEVAAANCYNHFAKIHHGEFAALNDCPYMTEEEWMRYRRGKNKSSQYRGVTHDKRWDKWVMQFSHKGEKFMERFDTEIEASERYKELVSIHRGKLATMK